MSSRMWCFQTGEFRPRDTLELPPDSSVWSGSIPFETLAYDGDHLFNPEPHLTRLLKQINSFPPAEFPSAEILSERLSKALNTVTEPARVNLYWFRSGSEIELVARSTRYRPPERIQYRRGVSLEPQVRNKPPRWPNHRVKRTDYAPVLTARARSRCFDLLYLNPSEAPRESSVANVFWLTSSKLYAPSRDQIFPGTVNRAVRDWAHEAGLELWTIDRPWWRLPGSCFLTNSLVGVLPVRTIGEKYLSTTPTIETLRSELESRQVIPTWY